MLGVPEQALNILHDAIETVLAHGSVMDKGRALVLMARCQLAAAGFSSDAPGHPGNHPTAPKHRSVSLGVLHCWCFCCRGGAAGCGLAKGGCHLLLPAEL